MKLWARAAGLGGLVTDPNGGFVLRNGARRSADAAWISGDRLSRTRACPEFVIELLSPGALWGWMINPRKQSVTVFRPGSKLDRISRPATGTRPSSSRHGDGWMKRWLYIAWKRRFTASWAIRPVSVHATSTGDLSNANSAIIRKRSAGFRQPLRWNWACQGSTIRCKPSWPEAARLLLSGRHAE